MRCLNVVLAALVLVGLMGAGAARAQTFAEWWRQNATQKKYLLEQIAALRIYGGYVRKGYEIVGTGLRTVRDITGGEFGLHSVFFDELKKVSPAVRNDVRAAEIVEMQVAILKAFGQLRGRGVYGPEEAAYVQLVGDGVLAAAYRDMEELLLVMTSGKVSMSDDERLSRLAALHQRMQERLVFTRHFCGEVRLLRADRERSLREVLMERSWYER